MAIKTYRDALREAMREEMLRDAMVFIMGEDVGVYGGIFGVTAGLRDEFGEGRVKDTPISEAAIAGAATGAAMTGMRPIAEIMFVDFTTIAMDQLVNQAAKWHYMSGGRIKVPLVLRTTTGIGRRTAAQHSQSLEAWHAHVPGLKVVMPSTPYDAKGLLKSAIRDDNPVVFIEHKMLYNEKGEVPEGEYLVPLGKADIKREGSDCTIVATSLMVRRALAAAEALAGEGIDIELVDPRTIRPLDIETICTSVSKTHRLIIVHEACGFCGVGAEIATEVMEQAFFELDAPVVRVTGKEAPIPFSPSLEDYVVPSVEEIAAAVRCLVKGGE
ncbi:MAG: acetoin:2,6-dichlorophenolindophenol oxidoreductase subunit beta [Clostridia bacterium]|nr:acetoin:2,6-dichlorophenolindophenol oxidoreductase subunit beta [Clostridia bacterium]